MADPLILLLPPVLLLLFTIVRLNVRSVVRRDQRRTYTFDVIKEFKSEFLIFFDLDDELSGPPIQNDSIDPNDWKERRCDAHRASTLLDFFDLVAIGVDAGVLDEDLIRATLEAPMVSVQRDLETLKDRHFAVTVQAGFARRHALRRLLDRWRVPQTETVSRKRSGCLLA